jgi:hypothetical protein
MISTFGVLVICVMSLRFGTCGYFAFKNSQHQGSISAKYSGFQPSAFQATVAASIPLHKLP